MGLVRGEIWLADFGSAQGSEIGKIRPCVIIQNDIGNLYSPTTIVAAVTSTIKGKYQTNVFLPKEKSGLEKDSMVLCSSIQTFSIEDRLIKKLGKIEDSSLLDEINTALEISLGLN